MFQQSQMFVLLDKTVELFIRCWFQSFNPDGVIHC